MAAGEGQGEDWQAFLNLGGAEDEEAPPALAAHAQPALVEDDDDNLPPPAHGGIGVPPALPVLPQGEVLGMIGELVDPVGPAAAHGADPPVHGADGGPALVLLPPQQQQQGVPPIVGMLEEQVMLMQGEPVLEQDDLLGQHGLAAADDGADLPVDGVPAPPLAPPPQQQQQQQPVPVVLTDDVREEDLEEASQMWNENQQALKRQQNEMLGPAPAAKRLAMDMFAAPPSVGFNFDGGGGGSSSLFSSAPHQGIGMHYSVVAPRQVAAVGDAAIVPVVMPQIGPGGVPPALAVQGPGFSFKEPPLERCKNCGFRPAILSRASRSTTSLNPFQQHTCLCEICQLSDSFRIAACDYCGDYAANNPLPH